MLKEWLDTGEVTDKKQEPKVEVTEKTEATSPASNVKEAFDDLFNDYIWQRKRMFVMNYLQSWLTT